MSIAPTETEIAETYAMLAELSNCTVTEVARPGRLRPNGDNDPDPVPVWTGEVRGFRSSERRTVVQGGVEVDAIVETVRIYDAADGPSGYTSGSGARAQTVVIDGRRWTISGVIRDEGNTLDSWLLELAPVP